MEGRKKIILHSTSYPRAHSFSYNIVQRNENRRENKEVLKINRNFSLAFTWDPLCQQAEKSFNDNWSIWAVITMSLEKHYRDDEDLAMRWIGAMKGKMVLKGRLSRLNFGVKISVIGLNVLEKLWNFLNCFPYRNKSKQNLMSLLQY